MGIKLYMNQNITQSKYSPVIQKLIEKYNLDTKEVDKIIQENRTERQIEVQEEINNRLDLAIKEQKITPMQKELILHKLEEWRNEKMSWMGLSFEERKLKMKEQRAKMQQWSKENNINLRDVFGFQFKMYGRGFRAGLNL
jgi:hypothetical protein